MGLALITAPSTELLTLEEAKAHLRQDVDVDDEVIFGYCAAARSYLEEVCNRSFVSSTWDFTLDYEWPWLLNLDTGCHEQMIEVPKAPLVSVTSITYVDSAGATQTLASNQYVVDGAGAIGRIYPAYDVTWPTLRSQRRAITVRFVAGYGTDAASTPTPIKQAALLLMAHMYTERQPVKVGETVNELPMSVGALIAPYRVYF